MLSKRFFTNIVKAVVILIPTSSQKASNCFFNSRFILILTLIFASIFITSIFILVLIKVIVNTTSLINTKIHVNFL